jgi:nitrate reductase beta subunit
VLLYDAERIESAVAADVGSLVDAQRAMLLDPLDEAVIAEARRCGIDAATIEAARRSPVDRFVRQWKLAVPLHPEFRTIPMLFYVPPLSPAAETGEARVSVKFLASLFGGGDESPIRHALRKEIAVRASRRAATVGDVNRAEVDRLLREADCSDDEADAIYRLTTLATVADRFVVPPAFREQAVEMLQEGGQ